MNGTVNILVPYPLVCLFSSTLIISSFSSLSVFFSYYLPLYLLVCLPNFFWINSIFPPLSLFPEIEGIERERERELGHRKNETCPGEKWEYGVHWPCCSLVHLHIYLYIYFYYVHFCIFSLISNMLFFEYTFWWEWIYRSFGYICITYKCIFLLYLAEKL